MRASQEGELGCCRCCECQGASFGMPSAGAGLRQACWVMGKYGHTSMCATWAACRSRTARALAHSGMHSSC